MKGDAAALPARAPSVGLPSSSMSERGVCSPTALHGRPAGGSPWRGFSTGAAKSPHAKIGECRKNPGAGWEGNARPPRPQIDGGTFPDEIQCMELMLAAMQCAATCPGLGHFIHRSLLPSRNVEVPEKLGTDLLPCPPLRWGRWTKASSLSPRRRRRLRFLKAKALCLQHLVIGLNWLALGCCRSPPDRARAGYPMTRGQHEMLERLEDLVSYFLAAGPVSVGSLGRAGEKLSKLSALIFSLPQSSESVDFQDIDSFLEVLQQSFDSYSQPKSNSRKSDLPDDELGAALDEKDGTRLASPRTRVSSSACSAKPVLAERTKWKLAPSFDPRPYLDDPVIKRAFEDPDILRKPPDSWPRMPRAKVHASRGDVLALAAKWDDLGACRLVPCADVPSIETVGMFAVPKDETFDRLILNPTVVNSRCFGYSRYTKTIAPGYLITSLQLLDDEQLLVSPDDLCEFYYTFQVSDKRARRNAIGLPFSVDEVSHLKCFDKTRHKGELYICLGTLAMGDALAVEIAQQSHLNLLRFRAGCMLEGECLRYREPVPRGKFCELLTIDDHIGLQKVKLSEPDHPSTRRDVEVFEAANNAYVAVGLTAHPGKRQRRETVATVLGAEIDGLRGRVSAPRGRVAMLCFLTAVLVKKGMITRKILQGLLGCWTHVCLFRRPSFAILDKVYSEGSDYSNDLVFHMSRQCKMELMTLCLLAPTLQTDLRVSSAPFLYMMDASPYGGGICRSPLPEVAGNELWRHTEQRGYYTKLQQGANAVLHELGIEHTELFGDPGEQFNIGRPSSTDFVLPRGELRDATVAFDCIELFAGYANWSKSHARVGLRVHPGIERSAKGRGYGDVQDNDTFHMLAKLASSGAIREWHAAPPCWSFGTLRRPRLRSKNLPAGFDIKHPQTKEQTLLAVRTAFLLFLAVSSGCFISCEQPGGSVMFELAIFRRLIQVGCQITRFCFCSFGSGFQKASKWLHNKPWYLLLEGKCSCEFKGHHFTVEGTFARSSIKLFSSRCRPNVESVYGRTPLPGEAVSAFSAGYPIPLCEAMASGSRNAHRAATVGPLTKTLPPPELGGDIAGEYARRPWFEDPEWVEDLCESLPYSEVFRFRFQKSGHINVLECRVYKTWLKHCAKRYPRSRLLALLDSRVTMGAAAKGRSSSRALSRVLRSGLGYILGGCLYPGTLHCRSHWNRADGPSRDGPVPGPSRPEASWVRDLRRGDFAAFDTLLTAATWTRPVGRWYRLLLLIAGDVERHPGPVETKGRPPRGELNLLGGFAQATSDRMWRCLQAFETWCKDEASTSLSVVLASSESANLALKAYGLHLFRKGLPRYWLVYAITAVQQVCPEYRRALSGAWQVDRKWQLEEPGQCRAVLSAPVLRAILAVALLWGWWTFAGVVALGFGGMLHPNEFLCLCRRDLVFPQDTWMEQHTLYVHIKNPKTARFARRQHVRIDDRSIQLLAWCVFSHLQLEAKLFPASTASFRRQWNCVLDRLEVPRRQAEGGATPGTLRGSGATFEYLETGDISRIQWRGRWAQVKTLEHYIQEVGAQLFLFNLSESSRTKIQSFSGHLSSILTDLFPSEVQLFATQDVKGG